MKILVTYESKTGFTKKYAEWIASDLACELEELSKVKAAEISDYDLIIHGGWIMGGMINGLNKIKEFKPKKMIVFGVGYTKKKEVEAGKIIETNKLLDTPFYYFEGGLNPKKMGFIGRTMIKLVTKQKPEYVDNTDRNDTNKLISLVKEM